MPFDAERIVQAALKAALEEPAPSPPSGRRPLLSTGRAMLLGAGAVTAARLAIRMRGGRLIETLHERLVEFDERSSPRDGDLANDDREPALEGDGEEFDPEEEDEEFDPEEADEELDPEEEDREVPVARTD